MHGGSKKAKLGTKKRELKLTISRAISDDDDIESRARSLASIKRARLKQNKVLTKKILKKI